MPASVILGAHYGAWVVVSLFILFLAGSLTMAKSNKPIIWGLFAAGGTLDRVRDAGADRCSRCSPPPVTCPQMLTYDKLHTFAAHWFGKLVHLRRHVSVAVAAAHRLRAPCTTSVCAPIRWWRPWCTACGGGQHRDDNLSVANLTFPRAATNPRIQLWAEGEGGLQNAIDSFLAAGRALGRRADLTTHRHAASDSDWARDRSVDGIRSSENNAGKETSHRAIP